MCPCRPPVAPPSRRLLRPSTVIAGLFLLLVGLALLAIPFLKAPGHAAGRAGRPRGSQDLADLRRHGRRGVERAERAAPRRPGAGRDAGRRRRHLEPGAGPGRAGLGRTPPRQRARPPDHGRRGGGRDVAEVNGDQATLFGDRPIDLPTLERLVGAVDQASRRPRRRAELELGEVRRLRHRGSARRLGEARDEAPAGPRPLARPRGALKPLRRCFPEFFGAEGERTYLLALLNPSRAALLRRRAADRRTHSRHRRPASTSARPATPPTPEPSSGRALGQGRRATRSTAAARLSRRRPTRPTGRCRARSCSTRSGPARTGQERDGLIAVDVGRARRHAGFTGPVEAPGYRHPRRPTTSPSEDGRRLRRLSRQRGPQATSTRRLVPVFAEACSTPGDGVAKIESAPRLRPRRGTSRSTSATPSRRRRSPTSGWRATSPTPSTTTSRSSTRTPTSASPTTGSAAPSAAPSSSARTARHRCA